jgi:hypothetical protein
MKGGMKASAEEVKRCVVAGYLKSGRPEVLVASGCQGTGHVIRAE